MQKSPSNEKSLIILQCICENCENFFFFFLIQCYLFSAFLQASPCGFLTIKTFFLHCKYLPINHIITDCKVKWNIYYSFLYFFSERFINHHAKFMKAPVPLMFSVTLKPLYVVPSSKLKALLFVTAH